MALIDRTELFNRLSDKWDKAELYSVLNSMEPVDAAPVIHAKWNRDDLGFYHCSNCHSETGIKAPFCFWCGSRMDEARMIKVSMCDKNNPCFVCRKKECMLSGDLMADCPKYRCDRIGSDHGDCESCAFLRGYIRDLYGQKALDKVIEKLEKDGDSE